MIGRVPAFLSTPAAQFDLAYLGPQPDRWKGAGAAWDGDYDPGHFIDLRDDATVANVLPLDALPATREAYDTALRAAGTDQYKQGYLPYSIIEGWEQVRADFAAWRRASDPQVRSAVEAIAIEDIGTWGHYVGDACQPLHVTVHFNDGGAHSRFESTYVNRFIDVGDVAPLLAAPSIPPPQALLSQSDVMRLVAGYLRNTLGAVPQLYAIDRAGGFTEGSPAAKAFTAARLAAGASELRDLTVLAWQDSAHVPVSRY